MKISKLFHSLYALLMLAPVFAVGGAMAFNIINDKAVDNAQNEDITYQKVNYQYETNEVNSADDLIDGNIYVIRFTEDNRPTNFSDSGIDFYSPGAYIAAYDSNDSSRYPFTCYSTFSDLVSFDFLDLEFQHIEADNLYYCFFSFDNSDDSFASYYSFCFFDYYDTFTADFIFIYHDIPDFDYHNIYSCPQEYIPYTLEDVNITYPDNLSDNFYFAMDSMNNSEVFSWAKTSFLAEPFSYIFGLFGIPSGSPFITLLSYWLSISIIWLVFDLVMYVPLLVHGWIDKGGIE